MLKSIIARAAVQIVSPILTGLTYIRGYKEHFSQETVPNEDHQVENVGVQEVNSLLYEELLRGDLEGSGGTRVGH